MLEQIGDAQDADLCLSRQEVLFKKMLAAIDHSEAIGHLKHAANQHEKRINNLEVSHNDTKEAVEGLKQFFLNQDMVIVDSVGELKRSVDAVIAHVNPMVDREEKIKKFILRWSIPIILGLVFLLIIILFFGDHAAQFGEFLKAIK